IELGLGATHPTPVPPSAPADASDPDPLSSQGTVTAGDPRSENTSFASMLDSRPESHKGENWKLPHAAHEVPLLTMTATQVVEVEDLAAATDSLGVPSIIKRSLLDLANEAGPEDQGTMAPKVPLPKDVLTTIDAPA
nr:hypothetical protein [Tanacetum cinerariifolium]